MALYGNRKKNLLQSLKGLQQAICTCAIISSSYDDFFLNAFSVCG
jgi:hypothetical protein